MADLPRTPITRQEEYLSRLAGENTTLPREPITREEMYLEGAIARVEAVEEEVEEIKNNPDVVDIVATYADLQAYDKSKLTDKDVIRVLADETHSGNSTYYRYNKSSNDFTFIAEITAGGGDGFKFLDSSDYNYPVGNPTSVNPGMLKPGIYFIKDDTVNVYDGDNTGDTKSNEIFIISACAGSNGAMNEMMLINDGHGSADNNYKIEFFYVDVATGSATKRGGVNGFGLLDGGYIVDNLTSSSSKKVLSANMGKNLNTKFTPTSGSGAPTSATSGILGKIYIDTDTDTAYMCTKTEGGVNTWKQITN